MKTKHQLSKPVLWIVLITSFGFNEMGFGVQGGAQVGAAKINYDLNVTNGPQLLTGSPEEAGQFEYEAYASNNKKKSVGGRFGFLPFSNSSLKPDDQKPPNHLIQPWNLTNFIKWTDESHVVIDVL